MHYNDLGRVLDGVDRTRRNRIGAALVVSALCHVALIIWATLHEGSGGVQSQFQIQMTLIGESLPATNSQVSNEKAAATPPTPPAVEPSEIASQPAVASEITPQQTEQLPSTERVLNDGVSIPSYPESVPAAKSPPATTKYYSGAEVNTLPIALSPMPPIAPSDPASALGGVMTLSVAIDEMGSVQDVVVSYAENPGTCDQTATSVLRTTHFLPAVKEGKLVASRILISIVCRPQK